MSNLLTIAPLITQKLSDDEKREKRRAIRMKSRASRQWADQVHCDIGYNPCNIGKYDREENKYYSLRFDFYLNDCTAYSYSWWQFVKRAGDTIYVNTAHYSMQTDQHQNMARNILKMADVEGHGLKIKYVSVRCGLNHVDREIRGIEYDIKEIQVKIANPRSHKKTNESRLNRINYLKDRIEELKELDKALALKDKK